MSRTFLEKSSEPPRGIETVIFQNTGWNALPLSYGRLVVSEVIQIGVVP